MYWRDVWLSCFYKCRSPIVHARPQDGIFRGSAAETRLLRALLWRKNGKVEYWKTYLIIVTDPVSVLFVSPVSLISNTSHT